MSEKCFDHITQQMQEIGGLDLKGSTVGHAVDPTGRRAIHVEDELVFFYYHFRRVTKKAEISSKNRMSEPDGHGTGIMKHKGGSRCAHVHAAALASEKGLMAGQVGWETFMRLHSNSEANYSDQKSRRIIGEVHEAIEHRNQVPPDSFEMPPDMTSIYINVVGVEKRCVFRLGRAAAHIGRSQRSSSADSVGSQYYDSQTAIQDLQAKL
ncbi:hypothetical protein C2S52_014950 [Perilla frutescens var. hirtella]|nr:hypothetical protein C2S52_014950 [Perilla frutescens var. hirtella]